MQIKKVLQLSCLSLILTGVLSSCRDKDILSRTNQVEQQNLRSSIAGEHVNIIDFGADPTGVKLSTDAIQQALNLCYNEDLPCYIPQGTYLVDKPITCRNLSQNKSHIIIGQGNKSIIKLKDSSPAFSEDLNHLFHFYYDNPNDDTPNNDPKSHYNQIIRNIKIDLGKNNPKAIAINHEAAQGSTIQNVEIHVNDAFAGIRGLMGSGAAVAGVKIIGGEYGVYNDNSRPAPVVTGFEFLNQKRAAIYFNTRAPLTIVGATCKINNGVFVEIEGKVWPNKPRMLSIIDSTVEFTKSGSLISAEYEPSIYLKNIHLKNVVNILKSPKKTIKNKYSSTLIKELSSHDDNASKFINGKIIKDDIIENKQVNLADINCSPKNHWPTYTSLDFSDKTVVNIKDFGAIGDGKTNDTAAIQKAINRADKIFIPKGKYLISDTLKLKAKTHLFGVSRNLSILIDDLNWDVDKMTPMIESVDDKEAPTRLADFGFHIRGGKNNNISALLWQVGRNSMVKDIDFHRIKNWRKKELINQLHYTVVISGNGGGQWFHTWLKPRFSQHQDSRYLLIENTSEPLNIYSICPEYASQNTTMIEIKNSKNINIFGLKTETYYKFGQERDRFTTPLIINDSENISIYSHDGKTEATKGEGIIELNNSRNVTITNLFRWGKIYLSKPEEFYMIREKHDNKTYGLKADHLINLFKRN